MIRLNDVSKENRLHKVNEVVLYCLISIDHMILFKKKSEEGLNEFKCKYCDMKFDDKERLKRHSRKAHSENEDFTPNANPFGGF